MRRRHSIAGVCSAFGSLGVLARAAAAAPTSPTHEYRVDFAADHVSVDGELGSLELDGNVRVQAQRYRLRSEHLRLRRGPRGVEVDGAADVAFCTCESPPVRLRVSHATLAPPTDALFANPKLELWGLPVLWLPGLWLRAPTRSGLTFPRWSYRARDGFFVGGGAYFPLASDDGRITKSLSIGAGAYLLHGARLEAKLDTERSSSRVAWDRVGNSAVEVDAHGSAAMSGATFAYRIDALRGARAPVEPSPLEVAARRTDRLRVSVLHVDELAIGFGLRADAPRAGAFRDLGAGGPELHLGLSSNLGRNTAYDAYAVARISTTAANHAETAVLERATLSSNARPGPFGVSLTASQAAQLRQAELSRDGDLRGGLQARVGLPLIRDYGGVLHLVEPLLVSRARVDASRQGLRRTSGGELLAAAGVDSSLGERATRQAASIAVRAGAIARSGASELVAMTRTTADARAVGISQSFAVASLTARPAVASLSRVRVGPADGLHLRVRADGTSGGPSASVRTLLDENWFDPARPFLDREGWSGGSEVSLPWTRALSTSAALDYDLTRKALLATWFGFGYRHPCGCLAVAGFAGHRVGRDGVDAWLGLDLAP